MATIAAKAALARPSLNVAAAKVLRRVAGLWFLTAIAGQLIFALYVAAFYGAAAARGDFEAWKKVISGGIVQGDPIGNAAIATHLLLAFIITIGGPLQLVPAIRNRFRSFHRWLGRIYICVAVVLSLGGLYMVWVRRPESIGGPLNWVAISINAALIVVFAAQALRKARARDIASHRRWALRLYIAVSGVWFLRVGVMLWILLNQGPVGLGDSLDGPAGIALSFAQYVVPLALLELYLRAQATPNAALRIAVAGLLALFTVAMAAGIVMATLFMWLPHI